tara:strand:- start:196 stop:858 length:663 start_codon:yes stop_codon:yes gene_type:complete
MSLELRKRIITSIFLLSLLVVMFLYFFVLIISVIIIAIIAWVEFYALISKIFTQKNNRGRIIRFSCKAISLLFLSFLIYIILITATTNPYLSLVLVYAILISIMTDIGGLIIGKIFKGKKLSKISPKKTISGSLGSFVFSIILIPFFSGMLVKQDFFTIFLLTLVISLSSQLGDLFISLIKRKANVKNTSDLLPGHGGILDRIDGILFSIPVSFLLFSLF